MELSESKATAKWSTQEELLLAFAVKRHGLKNWETVAMELQSRSNRTEKFLYTAGICKKTYGNLRKRFVSDEDDGGGGEGGKESFWWLEELRNLRVAELKMEVEGYDLSIETLQKKVKTMLDESEKSLHRNEIDLDEQKEAESLEEDKNNWKKAKTAEVAGNSGSGGDGNRSFNESNSTDNTRTGLANEPKPVEINPNHETLKPVGEEDSDSCKDISDSKGREKDGVDSAKVVDSSSESRERSHGTKGSSDIQSSASHMTRRNKRISRMDKVRNGGGVDGGRATAASPATVALKKGRGVGSKAEPIFGVFDDIRSHKHGGVFLRRLEIQKSRKYNNMVRRHVDLEMVQTRMENGSYSSCPAKIYVDLLLLCNNAIYFFPKSSSQSRVAHQLRQLVMKHIKKHTPIHHQPDPDPLPRPERSASLLLKQKSTAPIVVCKKRSSISSKPSSSINKIPNQAHNKSNDGAKKSNSNANEKPVTGVRSVRKSINPRPPPNSGETPESSKALKEKASELNSIDKKKGAANFLKRIKNNEPLKKDKKTDDKNAAATTTTTPRRTKRAKEESSSIRTSDRVAQTSTKRIGRPPNKKKGKEVLKGKRDRAGSEDEGHLKQPIKRSRR